MVDTFGYRFCCLNEHESGQPRNFAYLETNVLIVMVDHFMYS